MKSDKEFLLEIAKDLRSISFQELTSVEKKIFCRFEEKGLLGLNEYQEVEVHIPVH